MIRVSGRMLRVGTAAIPLHNITWVDAFRLKPRRGAIFLRTLMWTAGTVALLVYGSAAYAGGGDLRTMGFETTLPVLVLGTLVIAAFRALFAPARPVLAIEMAGGSAVVVTLPNMEELRKIAGQVVYAINHPEAEFTAIVNQFNSSNTNHFGPVVNMNGGSGNTGIRL
ncbi:hypothetical protein BX286_4653 [Streptomyces sp. 3211.6]|uniref:DUF6232 family protein n=1 Tax=Streptomyces TaxID=1883 RepID=UPI000F1089BE|nr:MULTISPECIES: DUF6232 family protein [Streptomyces]RKT06609.1 hypothetical protein BX286_4653 [Streptomyces sp. 3211.6]RPF45853.1 hypothetical protein EDD96_2419 [Streptomyces sp. Ag109_G2-6]